MGYEYRILFHLKDIEKFKSTMVRFGGSPSPEKPNQFEFGANENPEFHASATVVLESNGIYLCDHGGNRSKAAFLFRNIVDEALTYSDSSDSVVVMLI